MALKGAYLAYHAYPSPVLRAKGDYDLWLPEGVREIHAALQAEGEWRTMPGIAPDHHLPALYNRDGRMAEIHLNPFHPYRNRPEPPAFGKFVRELPDGSASFEPELHWLILLEHCRHDGWLGLPRRLLDLGFLQKKHRLSAGRISELRRELRLPTDPALIFEAFPDFFPEGERLFRGTFPRQLLDDLRQLGGSSFSALSSKRQLRLELTFRPLGAWGKIRFLARRSLITPAFLREKYGLPDHVSRRELLRCYRRDVVEKLLLLCRFFGTVPPEAVREAGRIRRRLARRLDGYGQSGNSDR